MSACLIARTAEVALREKRAKTPRVVTVAFPHRWSRSTLLAYVREHHPNETARILEWHQVPPSGEPLWLANPAGFANYARGVK